MREQHLLSAMGAFFLNIENDFERILRPNFFQTIPETDFQKKIVNETTNLPITEKELLHFRPVTVVDLEDATAAFVNIFVISGEQ